VSKRLDLDKLCEDEDKASNHKEDLFDFYLKNFPRLLLELSRMYEKHEDTPDE
jgi:hypothetical protein